jgi:hypothetical protein
MTMTERSDAGGHSANGSEDPTTSAPSAELPEGRIFRFVVGVNFLSPKPRPRMQYVHILVPTPELLDRLNTLRASLGFGPLTFDELVERCAWEESRHHTARPIWTETRRTRTARRALRRVGLERFVLPPDSEEIERETVKFESLADLQRHLSHIRTLSSE